MSAPASETVSDGGVELKVLLELGLSATVGRLLESCRKLAEEEHFPGLYGTGLMLIAIYRAGRSAPREKVRFGPTELARMIDSRGPDVFEQLAREFFVRERANKSNERSTVPRISGPLLEVFQFAKSLPAWDDILASRHLIVSLLQHAGAAGADSNAAQLLSQAGLEPRVLLVSFVNSLARYGIAQERSGWSSFAATLAPPVTTKRGPLMPGYGADIASGRAADDCLDLDATVSAMANLIASPELDGNLSLGVFGNWGSGKSFFMRRLQAEIDTLTKRARDEARHATPGPPTYWPNIVQVEFNAWHYVDANLLASLVAHLLEQLQRFKPDAEARKSELDQALEQLSLAAAARDAAKLAEQQATSAHERAQQTLSEAQNRVEDAAQELAKAAGRSLWVSVDEQLKSKAPDIAKQLATLRGDAAEAVEAGNSATTAIEPLYAELRDVLSTSGRLQALTLKLLRDPKGGKVLLQALALVALPLLVLLGLACWKADFAKASMSLTALIAAGAGAVTRAAFWLRQAAADLFVALKPLSTARASIEAALERAEREKQQKLTLLQQDLAQKSAALDMAQRVVVAKEALVQAAASSVGAVLTGSSIGRFIEQRLASSEYQKQLGMVAIIRRDFEQLSQLILGHNAQRCSLADNVKRIQEQILEALPSFDTKLLERMFDNLGVNRIVIYVDDLDRCPPERVVEVLQSIHLLLAFPVFVVVVGVDARWMAHSLSQQYPALLGAPKPSEGNGSSSQHAFGLVSPSDYLEKIFQIPFWVPPLDAHNTRSLLEKITRPTVQQPPSPVPPPNPERARVVSPSSRNAQPATTDPNRVQPASGNGGHGPGTTPAPSQRPATLTRPEVLLLDEQERAAMSELALVIGRSPRAAKRFVNSYRLLKAALSERDRQELAGLSDDGIGGLAAPMLMLAVVTGAPMLAASFFAAPPKNSLSPLDYLKTLAEASTSSVDVFDTFTRLRQFCTGDSTQRFQPLRFDDITRWSTRVAQFAFEDLATVTSAPEAPAPPRAEHPLPS